MLVYANFIANQFAVQTRIGGTMIVYTVLRCDAPWLVWGVYADRDQALAEAVKSNGRVETCTVVTPPVDLHADCKDWYSHML